MTRRPEALYPDGSWPDEMHAALYWNRKRRRLRLSQIEEVQIMTFITLTDKGGGDVPVVADEVIAIEEAKAAGNSDIHFKSGLTLEVLGTPAEVRDALS